MSYVVQEPLNSMKVQSWLGTSLWHGKFKFDAECSPGTSQFMKVKRMGDGPPNSIRGSSTTCNVVQEPFKPMKVHN